MTEDWLPVLEAVSPVALRASGCVHCSSAAVKHHRVFYGGKHALTVAYTWAGMSRVALGKPVVLHFVA